MSDIAQISEFGKVLLFLIAGIILVCLIFFLNRLMSPNHPNTEKLTSYECGEEPTGSAWLPFNSRFYVIALIFLLFEVEMVFVFPWATVLGSHEISYTEPRWGILSLTEMFIFLGVLILGLVYVWVKGDLDWIKPRPVIPTTSVNIPASLYEHVNTAQKHYKVKDFRHETVKSYTSSTPVSPTLPIRKPLFKPVFKNPADE